MKGYKVFKPDWTTMNNFQGEVGKTYEHTGDLKICVSGFHFCKNLLDCFRYYGFDPNTKVAEVEALGKIEEGDHKCVTDKIKIVREIPWEEVLTIVNTGRGNTGWDNTGDSNKGNSNTGHYNKGNDNSGNSNNGDYNAGSGNIGYYNTGNDNNGDYNTGHYNNGDRNTGDYNNGDYNNGDYNNGDYNSGSFNACCYSTGFFNTESSRIYMFNKPCDLTWKEINQLPGFIVLQSFRLTDWIGLAEMSNEEAKEYMKNNHFKEAFEKFWQNLDEYDRQDIKDLPNFDPEIFKTITGIDISDSNKKSERI